MKFRTTVVLLLLVIASLCVLFFHTTRQFSDRKHREQLLRVFPTRELFGSSYDTNALFPGKVNQITIERGKERIVLSRNGDDSSAAWYIEQPFRTFADPSRTMAIIKAIELMQAKVILRDEPDNPLSLATYGLTEPSRTVTFDMGQTSRSFNVGNATADSQNAYVARIGSTETCVYVVPIEQVAPFFLEASELRDNAAIRFDKTKTRTIEIRQSGHPVIRCRQANAAWTLTHPLSDVADPRMVHRLLNALSNLQIASADFVANNNPRRTELGLDHPSLTLLLTDQTGIKGISFGTTIPNRDTMVYATRSGDSAVFALPREILTTLQPSVQALRCKTIVAIMPDAITGINVAGAKEVHLELTGDQWEITSPGGYAADGFLARAFLEDLARTPVTAWIDDPTPEQLQQTSLDTPLITAQLTTTENHPEQTLLFGTRAQDHNLRHVRRGVSGPILLVPDRIAKTLMESPLPFLSKTVLEFEHGSASAIHIKRDEIEISLEKRKDLWIITGPSERTADPTIVDETLWALCYVHAQELLPAESAQDPEYGLSNPRMVVTVSVNAAPTQQKTLKIGKDCGDDSCYAKVDGVSTRFVISRSVFKTLMKLVNHP